MGDEVFIEVSKYLKVAKNKIYVFVQCTFTQYTERTVENIYHNVQWINKFVHVFAAG